MAIFHTKSTIDPFQMLLHRPRTDAEDRPDLRICLTLRHPAYNLRFALRESKANQRTQREECGLFFEHEDQI